MVLRKSSRTADPRNAVGKGAHYFDVIQLFHVLQDHEAGAKALKDAIVSFPMVVPLLADKLDLALGADIRGHPMFRIGVDDEDDDDEYIAVCDDTPVG